MAARTPVKKPAWQRELVLERIRILFDQAEKSTPGRSRRYIEMALKLSTRFNIRLSPELKRRFCKSCKSYLVPGKTSSIRTSPTQKSVITTCRHCGHVSRHPYRLERKKKSGN
jgi:ribonuclease P protein subunit RPR2